MNYEEFKEALIDNVRERVGQDVVIRTDVVSKNNGKQKEGIIVELGNTIFPIIYLDDLFEKYNSGWSIKEIVDMIMPLCISSSDEIKEKVSILLNGEWEKIKDTIEPCVINRGWNDKLLKKIPSIDILDLSIVFRAILDNTGAMSYLITNELINKLGISREELLETAMVKLNTNVYYISTLTGLIKECMKSTEDEEIFDAIIESIDNEPPIYVLSNSTRLHGAAGIARTDIISKFANALMKDLYILPSSIHEILLLPVKEDCTVEELRNMVKSINEQQVEPEERLSDNIYYFSREKGSLEIAV